MAGIGQIGRSLGTLARQAGATAMTACVLGVVAGLLMIAAEPSVVAWVEVDQNLCEVLNDTDPVAADRCTLTGFERHGGSLILVGLLTVGLSLLLLGSHARPAAAAITVLGLVVLAITLISDLPETTRAGQIGVEFDEAAGRAGFGFYMELAGGVLATVAGTLQLLATRAGRQSPQAAPATRAR